MSVIQNVANDVQTTITGGVMGSVLGIAAERLSNYVIGGLGIKKNGIDIGPTAAVFVVRAVVSSVVFISFARTMPLTTDNVFFPYMFFVSDSNRPNVCSATVT